MLERLHKVLATAGIASRREAERWIAAGRVTVDGHPAVPGQKVTADAVVRVDGKLLDVGRAESAPEQDLMYHKPVGEICSRRDPEGRPSVFDALPTLARGRWISVGRLDMNTSGLLLFTTDGALANQLMHPSGEVLRRYLVRVRGNPDDRKLAMLLAGVELEEAPARFESVTPRGRRKANRWFEVSLREGRKREVRRLWEAVGCEVNRLMRIGYGPLSLPRDLRPGHWRALSQCEAAALREVAKKKPNSEPQASY